MNNKWVSGTLGTHMQNLKNEKPDIHKGNTVNYRVEDDELAKEQIIVMLNSKGEKVGKAYLPLAQILLSHILSTELRMTGTVQAVHPQFSIVILKLEIKESNTGLKQTLQEHHVKFDDSE